MAHVIKIEYKLTLPKERPEREILVGNYCEY